MRTPIALLVAAVFLSAPAGQAQELVYQPVNPSFGGDPFNSSHLLSIAQEQNEFDDASFTQRDPIDTFADSVQRRILSEVSRQITDRIFGEQQQDSGTFTIGDTRIDFQRVGTDQIEIVLADLATGAETELTIPVPSF